MIPNESNELIGFIIIVMIGLFIFEVGYTMFGFMGIILATITLFIITITIQSQIYRFKT